MSQCFCPVRKPNKKWLRIKQGPKAKCPAGGKSCVLDKQTKNEQITVDGEPMKTVHKTFYLFISYLFIQLFICQPETMIEDVDSERAAGLLCGCLPRCDMQKEQTPPAKSD